MPKPPGKAKPLLRWTPRHLPALLRPGTLLHRATPSPGAPAQALGPLAWVTLLVAIVAILLALFS